MISQHKSLLKKVLKKLEEPIIFSLILQAIYSNYLTQSNMYWVHLYIHTNRHFTCTVYILKITLRSIFWYPNFRVEKTKNQVKLTHSEIWSLMKMRFKSLSFRKQSPCLTMRLVPLAFLAAFYLKLSFLKFQYLLFRQCRCDSGSIPRFYPSL